MREAFYVFMTLAYFLFKKGLASLTLDMFASKLGKWEISAMEFNKKIIKKTCSWNDINFTLGFEPDFSMITISQFLIILILFGF